MWQTVTLNLCSVLAIRVGKARTYIRCIRYRTRYTIYDRCTRGPVFDSREVPLILKIKEETKYFP
jgi:hypothetical protein